MKKRYYERLQIESVPCNAEEGFLTGSLTTAKLQVNNVKVEPFINDETFASAESPFKSVSFD